MSSAGSAVSLFGDRRAVLIVDLSVSIEESVTFLSDASLRDSAYVGLLQLLRAHHSPPDTLVFYTTEYGEAVLLVSQRRPVRYSSVLILEGGEAMDRKTSSRLAGHVVSLFPSVPSEKHKSIRPSVNLVTFSTETLDIPGVDHILKMVSEDDIAKLAAQISDIFLAGTSLQIATARTGIRELEESQPLRSALIDPPWITSAVEKAFDPVIEGEVFPQIDQIATDRLKRYIDEWDFYAPSLSRSELLNVIMLIFERSDVFEALEIPRETFQEFLLVVEHNYHENPYHNFYHAVDVLQCCYHVLNTSLMMRRMFKPIDVAALFVAALSHDVGHPSFTNPFLVENESLVAWLYNDRAVLENMHSAVLFAILRHPRYNFAAYWPRSQWKDFRSLVVAAILGTDMAQHFEYIRAFGGIDGAFSRALKCLNSGEGPLPFEDRRLLSIAIIKFADICNVVRPFGSARRWGFHLVCEFFHQGDWEKALGYQNTPMTFRSLPDLAKGQQYFLNNVASPLYRCVGEYFSELHFAEEQLRINLEQWRGWRPETDDIVCDYGELYPSDRERNHSH
jgi:hypothetical protein